MNVVLDLDGTIVFPSPAEIAIPGRTRATYLSAATAQLLRQISDRAELYIATARNALSVSRLVSSLPHVRFAGFVLECGLVYRSKIDSAVSSHSDRDALHSHLKLHLHNWEHVEGYERMICCIAPTENPNPIEDLRRSITTFQADSFQANGSWLFHQERHKIFAYPNALCKVSGLKKLGVEQIDFAAGDDLQYDGSLLADARFPLTVSSGDVDLIRQIRSRGGFVASETGHRAAEQLLSEIHRRLQ